jgi:hypothetical protein
MRRISWGLSRNWFLMRPLHYLSSRSYFGFEFAEIFVFEKRLPAFTDMGSRRLRVSLIQGVANSPHHWYAESPTPRITDTPSRRLPASPIWRVVYLKFLKENSLYRYAESSTPRTSDTASRRLPVLLSWRVADSVYHRYRESTTPSMTTPRIGNIGGRYSKKKFIGCRFSALLTAKPCL